MKTHQLFALSFGFFATLVLGIFPAGAQQKFTLAPNPELKIAGGSSLHDWDMKSNKAKGEGLFVVDGNQLQTIQNLIVEMEAESLSSGTKGLDNNAYKALKTNQHKQIKFVLKEIVKNGDSYTAKGDFTVAGFTRSTSFPVKVSPQGKGFNFIAEVPIKLTDFKIDPPTALLGTVKTRDEATISFNATFQPLQ